MRLEEEKKNYFLTGTRQMNEPRLTTRIHLSDQDRVAVTLILKDFEDLSEDDYLRNQPLSYLAHPKPLPAKPSKHKYKHPKTLQGYNTLDEYRHINNAYLDKQKHLIQKQIAQLEKQLD